MPHRRASALPPKCHHTTAVPKYISGRTSYLQVRLEFHRLPQVIPAFCNRPGFGPPRTYSARFTLLMVRSPGFGSPACDSYRPFGLAFASAPPVLRLNLATYNNSLAHSTKGTPSPLKGGSDRPEAHGFRICFTPLLGVLFTIPSRYWFTIGRLQYLALGCGHPCFPPDFACPAVLTFMTRCYSRFGYGSLTLSGRLFQYRSPHHLLPAFAQEDEPVITYNPHAAAVPASYAAMGLGSSRFARRYYGNPLFSSGYVRCFSSPGSLRPSSGSVTCRQAGLTHSDSLGSLVASTSPRHFAAWPRPSSAESAKASTMCSSLTMSFFSGCCLSVMVRAVIPQYRHARRSGRSTSVVKVQSHTSESKVEPRGFEPRTSAVQGRRSPRLSYGPLLRSRSRLPSLLGGRAWTRTRDLGLIRAAL